MESQDKLTFSIDSLTPETLPMSRFAQYIAELANLYGNQNQVHFEGIKRGSALLQMNIEEPAFSKVIERLKSVNTDNALADVTKAYKNLDNFLRKDNAMGLIIGKKGAKILKFPGREAITPEIFTVTQATTIDGVVIKIGGRDETIPVTLKDAEGKLINCQIRGAAQAKELSRHYLEGPIRIHGIGKWVRNSEGHWNIDSLTIQSYEKLDISPLDNVIADIRSISGNGWLTVENPIEEWRKMRGNK